MKAAVLHELKKAMTIEDFEMPAIGPDEVLIKVKACGVCHTDFKVIEGRIPSRMMVSAPWVRDATVVGPELMAILTSPARATWARVVPDSNTVTWVSSPCLRHNPAS